MLESLQLYLGLISVGAAIILPIAVLFGFFDNRIDFPYRFRTTRFLIACGVVLIISLFHVFVFIKAVGEHLAKGAVAAETEIAKNRAKDVHTLDNLSAVFPEFLNSQTETCYDAAISNYVQDQWSKKYYEETCKLGPSFCSNDEKTYFEAVRHDINPHDNPLRDLAAIDNMLGTVWLTAKDVYVLVRSFQGIIDPSSIGTPEVGIDNQAYETYRQYFLSCTTLTPLPWITRDAPIVTSPMKICLGKCS